MKKSTGPFAYIAKSRFVRSVFTRILAIFIIVSISITTVAFLSFTAEIKRNILADRQKQLTIVEHTISVRIDEIASIAYNIGNDSVFFFEPVDDTPTSGYEMSKMLKRYLVGNNFIKHLAYCRAAEPDTIYVSSGERSLSEFFITSFNMDKDTVSYVTQNIRNETQAKIIPIGLGDDTCFAYIYPLPQLSAHPQAHVLMIIPVSEILPLIDTLLVNSNAEIAIFSADGDELFRSGNLNETLSLTDFAGSDSAEEEYTSSSGEKYILQKVVADSNGWIYVSAIRNSNTLSGLANKQLTFIFLLLFVLVIAIAAMFISIIMQYKPISNLAAQVAEKSVDGNAGKGVVDERVLLSDTIATLRDSSEQKQKYETAYHEAEAASKAKSAFLSNMSHDIRTPMNAVIGMTAIALKHKDDPEYLQDCLQKVQISSRYLLDIINNVLDMSRIESGKIPLAEEAIYLPGLIDGVVALVAPSITEKSQTLEVSVDMIRQKAVIGDNVHLTQVFVNILSNAVKFTPVGGKLSLTAEQTDSDDSEYGIYTFTFSDTGIGMSPEFIGQVFDTFSRAEGMDTSGTEGTGLGMAISKNLVELMGGTIRCESELNRGTTFIVTMHMKLVDERAASELAVAYGKELSDSKAFTDAIPDLNGKRILLAEDNDINREIARKIIGETNADVDEAANGKEAVDAFAAHPAGYYDMILMDIQMPVMNGYEATSAIRALDRADAAVIPIYAMTANTFDEDVHQVKSAGMNGHIGKPYTPALLYKIFAQVLHP